MAILKYVLSVYLSLTCYNAIRLISNKPNIADPLILLCITDNVPEVLQFFKPGMIPAGGCYKQLCSSGLQYTVSNSSSGLVVSLLVEHVDLSADEGTWKCSTQNKEAMMEVTFLEKTTTRATTKIPLTESQVKTTKQAVIKDAIRLISNKPNVGDPLILLCITDKVSEVLQFFKPRMIPVGGCYRQLCNSGFKYTVANSSSGLLVSLLVENVDVSADEGTWKCSTQQSKEAMLEVTFFGPTPKPGGQTSDSSSIYNQSNIIILLWILQYLVSS